MTSSGKRWPMITAIVIGALLVLGLIYTFTMGHLLVRSEEPQEADAVVVLLGGTPERIMEAVYLYEEGYSDHILMVETRKEHEDVLAEEGVDVKLGEEIEVTIAVQMGVPEEAITIIPGDTESTQDEAVAVSDYLKDETVINSVLLVTSKSHSYRSSKIFERALRRVDRDIALTSVPSRLDEFDERTWFRDREEIQEVISETLKLMNYWLIERWQL